MTNLGLQTILYANGSRMVGRIRGALLAWGQLAVRAVSGACGCRCMHKLVHERLVIGGQDAPSPVVDLHILSCAHMRSLLQQFTHTSLSHIYLQVIHQYRHEVALSLHSHCSPTPTIPSPQTLQVNKCVVNVFDFDAVRVQTSVVGVHKFGYMPNYAARQTRELTTARRVVADWHGRFTKGS